MAAYDPDEEAPLDPAAERLRRKLSRLLVISGGIMLLGFIAVAAAIVYKLGLLDGEGEALLAARGEPLEARIGLPAGARLSSASLDDERALLTIEHANGGQTLILVDLRTGEILGRYALAPE